MLHVPAQGRLADQHRDQRPPVRPPAPAVRAPEAAEVQVWSTADEQPAPLHLLNHDFLEAGPLVRDARAVQVPGRDLARPAAARGRLGRHGLPPASQATGALGSNFVCFCVHYFHLTTLF